MRKVLIILIILTAIFILMLLADKQDFASLPTDSKYNVGIILNGQLDDSAWNKSHVMALESLRGSLNINVLYKEKVEFQQEKIIQALEDLIDKGAHVIFVTHFDYGQALLQVAEKHPQVKFFHATGTTLTNNIATYTARLYQASYLSGIVAGSQTVTKHIAYIAPMPNSEVLLDVNAFTLGVQSVVPDATVFVRFTNSWFSPDKERAVCTRLLQEKPTIDVLAEHHDSDIPLVIAKEHGLFMIGYGADKQEQFSDRFLTAPIHNWQPLYSSVITDCINGRFKSRHYRVGLEDKAVDISKLSPRIDQAVIPKITLAKEKILSGKWDVFYGPLKAQEGNRVLDVGETFTDQYLSYNTNWFVSGIDGRAY